MSGVRFPAGSHLFNAPSFRSAKNITISAGRLFKLCGTRVSDVNSMTAKKKSVTKSGIPKHEKFHTCALSATRNSPIRLFRYEKESREIWAACLSKHSWELSRKKSKGGKAIKKETIRINK